MRSGPRMRSRRETAPDQALLHERKAASAGGPPVLLGSAHPSGRADRQLSAFGFGAGFEADCGQGLKKGFGIDERAH